jgi:hypothetical protein
VSSVPPSPPDPDGLAARAEFDALIARGRELQGRMIALAGKLGARSGARSLEPGAVTALVDERGLITGFEFVDGWRDGLEPAEYVSLFDLSLAEVADQLPPQPPVDITRLSSADFSGGPVTVADLSGAFAAIAAYGTVMRFRIDPAALAAARDETVSELLADVARRAALESDLLGRYAAGKG